MDVLWFQQDDAKRHRANETIDLLEETFGERIIYVKIRLRLFYHKISAEFLEREIQ